VASLSPKVSALVSEPIAIDSQEPLRTVRVQATRIAELEQEIRRLQAAAERARAGVADQLAEVVTAGERVAALEAALTAAQMDADERVAALEAALAEAQRDADERVAGLEGVLAAASRDRDAALEELSALYQTRVLRWTAMPRLFYGRLRSVVASSNRQPR
jgi:chromosome segregation ATPase